MVFLRFYSFYGFLFVFKIFFYSPIRNATHFAPRVVVRVGPRFRPRTAVANDIIPGQIVFIQFGFFTTTAMARRTNYHFVLAPFYPCAFQCKRPRHHDLALKTVVDPPAVLFKYLDDAGTFSPIFAQHGRCWFCIVIDYRLDFVRKLHCVCLYL